MISEVGSYEDHPNGTYQCNDRASYSGGDTEDVDDRVQPAHQFIIARRRFLDRSDLSTKQDENLGRSWRLRVAGLQLVQQRMSTKAFLRLLFVRR
jgi:hypothetical protein